MKVVTLKLPEDIYYLLKEYAHRRNMPLSDIIRRALIEYLREEISRPRTGPTTGST